MGAVTDLISIVDADPGLAELLDESQRERARREALTRVRRLSPGDWDVTRAIEPDTHHHGFLIIDGLREKEHPTHLNVRGAVEAAVGLDEPRAHAAEDVELCRPLYQE